MKDKEEKAFWESRRELRHLRDFAQARRATPWATLGVTLARVVAATPYEWQLPKDGCLNLFVGLVGRSGAGKGRSTMASRRAVHMADVKVVPVGSGEGLAHQFAHYEKGDKDTPGGVIRDAYNLLVDIPEVDTLASISGRSGSTLLPELRKAWSGEAIGMAYAAKEKSLPIEDHSYRLALIAGVQPARAGALLADEGGGTPQRFVWLPVKDPNAPEVPPEAPEPIEWRVPTQRRGAVTTFGTRVLRVCTKALRDVDAFDLANLRDEIDPIRSHEMLARMKVAAALGLYNGRAEISDEDWQLSELLMTKSRETLEEVEALAVTVKVDAARERGKLSHVASEAFNDEERRIKQVCDGILRKLDKPKPHNELRRDTAYRLREYFDGAVERLLAEGLVVKDENDHGAHYRRNTR